MKFNKTYSRLQWNRTQLKRDSWERKYVLLIRTVLNKQFKALSDRIDATSMSESLVENIIEREPIEKMMVSLYANVGIAFAKDQFKELKAESQDLLLKDEDKEVDKWYQYMVNYAKVKAGKRITSITGSGRAQAIKIIRTYLELSTIEGWGADVTASKIKKALIEEGRVINKWRALRIARTEIVTASNQGAMEGARSLDMPMEKFWLPTYDQRTRDTHSTMEQQNPKDMDSDFQVGVYKMDSPGDPDGGPEETINCRCGIAFGIKGM